MSAEKTIVSVEKIVVEISKSMNSIMTHVHALEEGLNARDRHIIYQDEQLKKYAQEAAKKEGQ